MFASVLIVCEGNICRSPMAAGIFSLRLPAVRVWSAGIGALIGSPPASFANQVMRMNGIDISTHRARQLTVADCREAELILVMDEAQKSYFHERHKGAARPVLAERFPADPAVESLRSLRTALKFALLAAPSNVVLITGATPGLGKSFISVNLAAILASGGQRVLLVDGDLRRGYHR